MRAFYARITARPLESGVQNLLLKKCEEILKSTCTSIILIG